MTFWNDIRLGARLLVKDKWFTLAAVAALALGIAANNTVFTIVNGVLLRDLPFDDPDRIVAVGVRDGRGGTLSINDLSYPDARDWQTAATRTFEGISRVIPAAITRVEGTDPWIFGTAATQLVAVALVACLIPGRRAMRLNPVVALRSE